MTSMPLPTNFQVSISKTAFERARDLCRSQHLQSEDLATWLEDKFTATDVQNAVQRAFEVYQSRKNGRIQRLLADFSGGVNYYGQIMDVLVQHHPEYVSLAWGTTKFLFVVSLSHQIEERSFLLAAPLVSCCKITTSCWQSSQNRPRKSTTFLLGFKSKQRYLMSRSCDRSWRNCLWH